MRNAPSNSDNVIGSRDVIERIEELQAERDALVEAVNEASEFDDDDVDSLRALAEAKAELEQWEASDEAAELRALETLAEECEAYASDWTHGETLIRDTYFQEYARDLAEDCGMIDPKVSFQWPYTCIDWKQAARELQHDYARVDFDGVEYWIRSC